MTCGAKPKANSATFSNELYVDDVAVAAHMASDHFKAFRLAASDLATAPPLTIKTLAIDVADQFDFFVTLPGKDLKAATGSACPPAKPGRLFHARDRLATRRTVILS
jgi:hypothetical protein